MNRVWLGLGWLATVCAVGATVVDSEYVRAMGDPIYLELAPVDPRSLIQGDYMRLSYQVGREASVQQGDAAAVGDLVLSVDEENIGTFLRFDEGTSLGDGEHRLDYRRRHQGIDVGTRSWMFQEGTADVFDQARYGAFRVLPSGRAVLVALCDGDRTPLGEPLKAW